MTESNEALEISPEEVAEPFVDEDYDSSMGSDENFRGVSRLRSTSQPGFKL